MHTNNLCGSSEMLTYCHRSSYWGDLVVIGNSLFTTSSFTLKAIEFRRRTIMAPSCCCLCLCFCVSWEARRNGRSRTPEKIKCQNKEGGQEHRETQRQRERMNGWQIAIWHGSHRELGRGCKRQKKEWWGRKLRVNERGRERGCRQKSERVWMVSLLSPLPTQTATQQPCEQVLTPPHRNRREQQVQPLFPPASLWKAV